MFSTTLIFFAAFVAFGQCQRGASNRRSPATMGTGGLKAVAVLTPSSGSKVNGTIIFRQMPGQVLVVTGTIRGLKPGMHAFDIHEFGDMTDGCTSMGDHFNPGSETHGISHADARRFSDLGDIEADADGNSAIDVRRSLLTLRPGKTNILGRGLIVHEKVHEMGPDIGHDMGHDMGQDMARDAESLGMGDAGARQACGVIGY